jgi:hypothetical protein
MMKRRVSYSVRSRKIYTAELKFIYLGIVQFINEVVPDANIDPNGNELFERVKDGLLLK